MPTDLDVRSRRGAGVAADAARLAALLSALASLLWLPGETALRFGLLFAVLLVPRYVGIPRPFDAVFSAGLLLATWAGVRDWYVSIVWMDEAVHLVVVGATAAAAYLVLARLQLMPAPQEDPVRHHRTSLLILVGGFGLGIAALWEIYEWAMSRFAPRVMHVGYGDTMIDLVLGGAGSLVAGGLLIAWAHAGRGPGRRLPEDRDHSSR